MNKLLLFAGTTEGRELAEFLDRQGVACDVSTATEYGGHLLEESTAGHDIHSGRLSEEEMEGLIDQEQITMVVDATHPYAVLVSDNIRAVCRKKGCTYLRLLREEEPADNACVFVPSVEAAVEYLQQTSGNVLAATGSKELKKYTALPDYQTRVFARVLSTPAAVWECAELGFQGKNLICMQGPFDEELNYAMMKQIGARFLVTKESGKTGGFPEKMRAARRAGAKLVVVGRPGEEEGYSMPEIRRILCEALSIRVKRNIALAGIGMGTPESMTSQVRTICEKADVLIGARRMLDCVTWMNKPEYPEYRAEKIRAYLDAHPEYENVVLLLSGDVGFYSGAKKLLDCFAGEEPEVYCGISSVVYLCSRLHTSWDDVKLVSVHGRTQNLIGAVCTHQKVFALIGKEESFRTMCGALLEYGLGHVKLSVGCQLSYPDEKIWKGSPAELQNQNTGDLTAVLIENEQICSVVTHGIEDEAFERAKVPMTKAEIRSISLSKLQLTGNSVIYDVGAGTGSVSIEMALQSVDGMVYAVEKKPEAVELIRRNQKKFGVSNLQIIEGSAPEALQSLPVPTHAFIGGSSGNLREIMECLLEKNPDIRIVINTITLESAAEALKCLKELPVACQDIVSVSVAKAKCAGDYHLMMGQNPVYIFSCGKGIGGCGEITENI
ncbi:MAG: precorrin-6A reductase [Lachnospiraceae bacterium]|nr:precorrin-6A reductase [Lachnospiraceae bacterium]